MAALDTISRFMATNVYRERLRKQLIGKKMRDDEESILLLIAFINKRQVLAQIKDYTFIGLQSSEAISKEIAQASQDAFKATTVRVVISTIVNSLKAITSTVKDRKDQKVTVHFDQEYSSFGNFTISEVVAMRSIFVETTISQILKSEPQIGILSEFEGDGVQNDIQELRHNAMSRYVVPIIPHGIWNRLVTGTSSGYNFQRAILIMRFHFDTDTMYARNLSMLNIIDIFKTIINGPASTYRMALAASSMRDGIIDVCINVANDPLMSTFQTELLTLDSIIKDLVKTSHTGGISKVLDMNVVQTDMIKLFTVNRPASYTLAELGKREWLAFNDLNEVSESLIKLVPTDSIDTEGYVYIAAVDTNWHCMLVPDNTDEIEYNEPNDDELTNAFITFYMEILALNLGQVVRPIGHTDAQMGKMKWIDDNSILTPDISSHVIIVPESELDTLSSYAIIGRISEDNDQLCVFLYDNTSLLEYPSPTKKELRNAYEDYYFEYGYKEVSVENVWVIELNIISMKLSCVDYKTQIKRIFEYCGITPASEELHELVDLPCYIYVVSEENPKDIIARHFASKQMVTYGELSPSAQKHVKNWAISINDKSGMKSDAEAFYTKHYTNITQRLSKYVYSIFDVEPKNISKSDKPHKYFDTLPYEQHVLYHAYSNIIRIPFVDRYKTTSNDWYTNTYTLGADCSRNIYAHDFYQIASASSSTDPRHVELFCDIVFEKGFPAGSGQHSSEIHDIGTISQMSTNKQKAQLATAWNKGAESAQSLDVAVYTGAPIIGLDVRVREVRAKQRMEAREKANNGIRLTRKHEVSISGSIIKTVTYEETESALMLAVKDMHIGVDPFNIAVDISDPPIFENKTQPLDPEIVLSTYYGGPENYMISRLREDAAAWIAVLKQYKTYKESTTREIVISETSGIINITPLYTFLLANKTAEFFLP